MSNIDWNSLATDIRQWGIDLGFADVGFTGTELAPHQARLNDWLNRDFHGEMDYMARHGDMRSRPAQLHAGTQTVISLRLDYLEKDPAPESVLQDPSIAYVARYALGRDYHKVIRRRLKSLVRQIDRYLTDRNYKGFSARIVTDSAPLLEKAIAENAGIGWIGKNTLLINEKAGSWFFLAEILTNLPLPHHQHKVTNRCGSCSACIDVCPTGAIIGPYQLDAKKCISYLTIEHRGSIDPELRPLMGNRVFGCDDCQMVCPWNRYAGTNQEEDFKPRHNLQWEELLVLFTWTEDEFLKRTEGSAIRRTGYNGWIRNIAVALGNAPHEASIVKALNQKLGQCTPMVDEHIEWAIQRQTALSGS